MCGSGVVFGVTWLEKRLERWSIGLESGLDKC